MQFVVLKRNTLKHNQAFYYLISFIWNDSFDFSKNINKTNTYHV
jgi:hypothetical protein